MNSRLLIFLLALFVSFGCSSGKEGLDPEQPENTKNPLYGVWLEDASRINRYWTFRLDGSCSYYFSSSRNETGVYKYTAETSDLVTSISINGQAYVFHIMLMDDDQMVLQNSSTSESITLTRITKDDESSENASGYWCNEYDSKKDLFLKDNYTYDAKHRILSVEDREYYVGYISSKYLELLNKKTNEGTFYRLNQSFNLEEGLPTVSLDLKQTKGMRINTGTPASYSYSISGTIKYTSGGNIGNMSATIDDGSKNGGRPYLSSVHKGNGTLSFSHSTTTVVYPRSISVEINYSIVGAGSRSASGYISCKLMN